MQTLQTGCKTWLSGAKIALKIFKNSIFHGTNTYLFVTCDTEFTRLVPPGVLVEDIAILRVPAAGR